MPARRKSPRSKDEIVRFEAALVSKTETSMFATDTVLSPETLEEVSPAPGRGIQAATALQSLGFTVRHIGTFSISAEGPRKLWERVFKTKVERRSQPLSEAHPDIGKAEYFSHVADTPFEIPKKLSGLVERAYPQRPPTFFESPLPPRVAYHHLQVHPMWQ